jgi:hypothetical protein
MNMNVQVDSLGGILFSNADRTILLRSDGIAESSCKIK